MATVELDKLTKIYPNGFKAVSDLDLDVAEGEFMVLVGPSGCGKTTALRMVAGLEDISGGTLRIGGRVVNDVSPKDRDIAMVFQNYALYPHMTVGENIGFALKLRKTPKAELERMVREAAGILGLTDQLDRKPGQLSGGQRQRVAMGRAIVRQPSVFLMDEPLSNLDAKLRVQMRAEVSRIQRRLAVATLYVTHDQTEAMTMGDRVAVLRAGVLQQCDAPQVLYDRPSNLFVAAFIGSPAMNLYEGRLASGADGRLSVAIGGQSLVLPQEFVEQRPGLARVKDQDVVVGIRPESLEERSTAGSRDAAEDGNILRATTDLVEALGSELMVHFRIEARRVQAEGAAADDENLEDLAIGSESPDLAPGVARVDPRAGVKAGDPIDFVVNTSSLHFFSDDGEAIWN